MASYSCVQLRSWTNKQQQWQPGHPRFSQDLLATNYTRINVFQWRLATSYRGKVTETRNCRDLAVAELRAFRSS
jgi:hypothetical protein